MPAPKSPEFRALFRMITRSDAGVAELAELFAHYVDQRHGDRVVASVHEGTQWQVVILFKNDDLCRAVSMMENVIGRVSIEPNLKDEPVYPCIVAKVPMRPNAMEETILEIAKTAKRYPHTPLSP